MRVREIQTKQKKNKPLQRKFQVAFVGTAWCIVDDRYLVTAHHIFEAGKPRVASDRFFAFTVPGNGPVGYHTRVLGFPLEDSSNDLAVLEVKPSGGFSTKAISVTFRRPADGETVLTLGFPAPIIASAQVDNNGDWAGGNILLKSHANEGIVSAQYDFDKAYAYELNVGWHHGESGGPIAYVQPLAVFALMQFYRNITGPHGVVPGPHVGRSISVIGNDLNAFGARIV